MLNDKDEFAQRESRIHLEFHLPDYVWGAFPPREEGWMSVWAFHDMYTRKRDEALVPHVED